MHSLNKFWTKDAKRQKHPTVIFGEPGTKSGCREKKRSTAHAPCTQHHLRGGVADHLSHHSRLTTGHTPVLVAQSCPTLCDPCGPYPARLLCPWNSPGKNHGVGSHSLLQGIFLTQGSNPRLLHCRQILYPLSHQGSPQPSPYVRNQLRPLSE